MFDFDPYFKGGGLTGVGHNQIQGFFWTMVL